MDRLILEYLEKLGRAKKTKYLSNCIELLNTGEFLYFSHTMTNKETFNFFKERLNMQSYLPKNLHILDKNLLEAYYKIKDEELIKHSNFITNDFNFLITEILESGDIIDIIKGFDTINKRNKINKEYIKRGFSVNTLHYINGKQVS